LARADAAVLIGDGQPPAAVGKSGLTIWRADLAALGGERLRGARVIAFAGIGRPSKFFASLREIGADVIAAHAFSDHHRFRPDEIARLRVDAQRARARLVTTAKDWVRLPRKARSEIEVLEVELRWRDPAAPIQLLSSFLDRAPPARANEGTGLPAEAMTSLGPARPAA
jgi:tetraacyldisaccharide 4'-kinase